MRSGQRHQPFPVLLYASFVVALLSLVRPAPMRSVQSLLGAAAVLPLRWGAEWFDSAPPAAPDDPQPAATAADVAPVKVLLADLESSASRRPAELGFDLQPRPVAVVARLPGSGASDQPGAVVLDVPRHQLDVAALVTRGDVLLGFLLDLPAAELATEAGLGPDAVAALADRAVVRLLHDGGGGGRLPRRVPSLIELSGRGLLNALVEPAPRYEQHPLRLTMLGDPYLAAELGREVSRVQTSGLLDDPLGALPAGLTVGWLRVFGYQVPVEDGMAQAGETELLPIGLFVEPPCAAADLDHVVVWQRAASAVGPAGLRDPLAGAVTQRVRAVRVVAPTAGRRRFLVIPDRAHAGRFGRLPVGAAVLGDRRLLGTVADSGPGYGVVAPFGQPGRSWRLLWVGGRAGPRWLRAEVVARQGGRVRMRPDWVRDVDGRDAELPAAGQVFTVGGGLHLPAHLWVGAGRLLDSGELEVDHLPTAQFPAGLEVFRRSDAGGGR